MYDLSIIIPMYNAEKTIERALNSIYKNQNNLSKIEVIVIDDGSRDSSLDIVEKSGYDSLKIIRSENHGVSHARNLGIKSAEGRYIAFMDADDTFGNNNFFKNINYFDSHEGSKTDIIVYPEYRVREFEIDTFSKTGIPVDNFKYELKIDDFGDTLVEEKHLFGKNQYYSKGTGIYKADTDYFIGQLRISALFRNYKLLNKSPILFNESLPYGEDSVFVTQYVNERGTIGYFKEGCTYNYIKTSSETVNKYDSAVKSKDMILQWANQLILSSQDGKGNISRYTQGVLLNEFGWRIKATQFFPVHLDEVEYKKWEEKIKAVLDKIDESVFLNGMKKNKDMDLFNVDSLALLRGTPEVEFDNLNNIITFKQNKNIIRNESLFEVLVNDIAYNNNEVEFIGTLKWHFMEVYTPKVFTILGNNKTEIKLEKSPYSYHRNKIESNTFYTFKAKVPVEAEERLTFEFEVLGNKVKPHKVSFFNSTLIPYRLGLHEIVKNNFKFDYDNNNLTLSWRKATESDTNKYLYDVKRILITKDTEFSRDLLKLKDDTLGEVWLYSDSYNTVDNAWLQFKHDMNYEDGVCRKYVYYKENKRFIQEELEEFPEKFILFGSGQHKKYFVNATVVITAYQDLKILTPYNYNEVKALQGIYNYHQIYLQHGVLTAHYTRLQSREMNPQYLGIVTSAKHEHKNYIDMYHFDESQIIPVGMPRFAEEYKLKKIYQDNHTQNYKVLIVPSWRWNTILGYNSKGAPIIDKAAFLSSNLFGMLEHLFENNVSETLKQSNIKISIKLHPLVRDVIDSSSFENNHSVSLVSPEEKIEMSDFDLVVTDFSSYIYDAIEERRPILFFNPDKDEFKAGALHPFSKVDLPDEKIAEEVSEFSDFLEKLILFANNRGLAEKYISSYEDIFQISKNNLFDIYEWIFNKSISPQFEVLKSIDNINLSLELYQSINKDKLNILNILQQILVIADMQAYKDEELVNKATLYKKGTILEVIDIKWKNNLTPVLKLSTSEYMNPNSQRLDLVKSGGQLQQRKNKKTKTSNNLKNVVHRHDINSYIYNENISYIQIKKSVKVYKNIDFNSKTYKKENIKRYKIVPIEEVEWTPAGTPRLKTKKGYITANKDFVKPIEMDFWNRIKFVFLGERL